MKPVWIALPACVALLVLVFWLMLSQRTVDLRMPTVESEPSASSCSGEPLQAERMSRPSALANTVAVEQADGLPGDKKSQDPSADKPDPEPVVPPDFSGEVLWARGEVCGEGGPTFVMIGKLVGEVPPVGAILELRDIAGGIICSAKVFQHYKDDKATEAVVKIGAEVVDGPPGTSVPEGGQALWPKDRRAQHGDFSAEYDSGNRACEGWYDNGARIGEWSYWYADGQLRARGSFKNDEVTGIWRFWYEDGRNWAEWREGEAQPWTVWQPNGRQDLLATTDIPSLYREASDNLKFRRFKKAGEIADRIEELLAELDDYNIRADVEGYVAELREQIETGRETPLSCVSFDEKTTEPLTQIKATPVPPLPPPLRYE